MDDHDHSTGEPCRCRFVYYSGNGFERPVSAGLQASGHGRLTLSQWVLVQRAVDLLVREHGFTPRYALDVLADQAQDWNRTVPEQAARIITGRSS